ncbi:uncharacterized protein LOC5522358 [Nematostella vectensis]|uniref:uncharacterized protein LOC5522358 n=1 Tax=Nematostella vectensis TaxID=45351 RepID=UPI0020771336|nr:uncharacterized protein LOC5522358 [Nematostella vectensis]
MTASVDRMALISNSLHRMERPARTSVRRCLFGPVDHEQTKADLQREIKKVVESESRRWNFDFASETPQVGRYAWFKRHESEALASNMDTACTTSLEQANRDILIEDTQQNEVQNSQRNVPRCELHTTTKSTDGTVARRKPKSRISTVRNLTKRPSTTPITDYLRQKKPKSKVVSTSKGMQLRTSNTRSSIISKQTCLDKFFKN